MKELLIIGDDVHTIRYISSILYNDKIELTIFDYNKKTKEIADHYLIKKINHNDLKDKINDYDYIIYTLPNSFNKNIFEILKDYKNNLLLEKPQLNIELIKKLNCRVSFIHLRNYDNNNYKQPKQNNNIIWPNLINDGMDPIINTTPNIIDFVILLYKDKKIDKLEVINIKHNNGIDFTLKVNTQIFNIHIINTNDKELLPKYNEETINWPNYFLCITDFINELLYNNVNFENSIKEEEKINKIIKQIRGDKNGFKENEL